MKHLWVAFTAILFAVIVFGCSGNGSNCCGGGPGGGNGGGVGAVAGKIIDLNGNVIRNATVFVDSGSHFQTLSSSNGTYVLNGVPAGDQLVQATAVSGGVNMAGQNFVTVASNAQTQSLNVTVAPVASEASIHGTVVDNQGNLLSGAFIFASAGTLGSTITFTGGDGTYTLNGLFSGVSYTVTASGAQFDNDSQTNVNLTAGASSMLNFTLTPASNPALPPPTGVGVVSWTSPAYNTDQSRTRAKSNPFEVVKNLTQKNRSHFNPALPNRMRRAVVRKLTFKKPQAQNGINIEDDVSWTPVSSAGLLGYGIYRRDPGASSFTQLDLYPDPLGAFYEDMDPALQLNASYDYEVTSVNTAFPNQGSESGFSSIVTAFTLQPLTTTTVNTSLSPIQFTYDAVPGVNGTPTTYAAFVFSQYPTNQDFEVWDNYSNPVSGTTITYGGPALVSGQTYYVIIVALSNNGDSRSIGLVTQFVAP